MRREGTGYAARRLLHETLRSGELEMIAVRDQGVDGIELVTGGADAQLRSTSNLSPVTVDPMRS
jgi:hypothetical protein